jgi:argininosuccinate lyase
VSVILGEATQAVLGRPIEYAEPRLAEIISPENFVRVRTTPGGPAPSVTTRALAASRQTLADDNAWIQGARSRLRAAEQKLREAALNLG